MAVNATAIWRVRPSGSNTNGGGYDAGISGAATDYSQQNAAQATGAHGTATGTTTFTDAVAANFTSAMVGNALWIASGAGFTTGAYFITAFTSATQVTLDRSPGTGTVAVWALGGGWADFFTNTTSSGPLVPGNVVFILGSGTPNPASYTYDYAISSSWVSTAGNSSVGGGYIYYANDPSTPGYRAPPNTTGGMPTIQAAGDVIKPPSYVGFKGIWFVASSATNSVLYDGVSNNPGVLFGCVSDEFGFAVTLFNVAEALIAGCEMFDSTGTASIATGGVNLQGISTVVGCNIHDLGGGGIFIGSIGPSSIVNNIIAKNRGRGIAFATNNQVGATTIINNTIDGNTGDSGIAIFGQNQLAEGLIVNNIISNHTAGGAGGVQVFAGTAAKNELNKAIFDYNTFYNNTSNYVAVNAGPHDTALGVSPYVNSATENYALA